MAAATFGDLLEVATSHLEAAVIYGDQGTSSPHAAAQQLHRLISVMTRYMGDITPWDEAEALGRTDLTSWQHAAVDITEALHLAGDALQGITNLHGQDGESVAPPADHLADAITAMLAGRDLLHTHQTASPDGLTAGRSEWAQVVTSAPVSKALTAQIAHPPTHRTSQPASAVRRETNAGASGGGNQAPPDHRSAVAAARGRSRQGRTGPHHPGRARSSRSAAARPQSCALASPAKHRRPACCNEFSGRADNFSISCRIRSSAPQQTISR